MTREADSADRSFRWLVVLASVPFALLGATVCLLLSMVVRRLSSGGVAALSEGPGDLRPAVLLLLAGGAAIVMTTRSVHTQLLATRRLAQRVAELSAPPPARLTSAAGRARLIGRVDFLDTPEPLSFTHGLQRPRVAVSAGLLRQIDDEELGAVLAHERYHVRRLDPVKIVVARAMSAGCFFLPVLVGLLARYRAGRELGADRTAMREHGRASLAGALYRVTAVSAWPELASAAALGGPDLLEARVRQLETGREPSAAPIPATALATTALVLGLLVVAFLVPVVGVGGPAAVMRQMMTESGMGPDTGLAGMWWCAVPLLGLALFAVLHRAKGHR